MLEGLLMNKQNKKRKKKMSRAQRAAMLKNLAKARRALKKKHGKKHVKRKAVRKHSRKHTHKSAQGRKFIILNKKTHMGVPVKRGNELRAAHPFRSHAVKKKKRKALKRAVVHAWSKGHNRVSPVRQPNFYHNVAGGQSMQKKKAKKARKAMKKQGKKKRKIKNPGSMALNLPILGRVSINATELAKGAIGVLGAFVFPKYIFMGLSKIPVLGTYIAAVKANPMGNLALRAGLGIGAGLLVSKKLKMKTLGNAIMAGTAIMLIAEKLGINIPYLSGMSGIEDIGFAGIEDYNNRMVDFSNVGTIEDVGMSGDEYMGDSSDYFQN